MPQKFSQRQQLQIKLLMQTRFFGRLLLQGSSQLTIEDGVLKINGYRGTIRPPPALPVSLYKAAVSDGYGKRH